MTGTRRKWESKFTINDKVIFDNHKDIIATITTVAFGDGGRVKYYLEWVHSGQIVCSWIEEWRVVLYE